MELNFILPYTLNQEPPYPYINGPSTCQISNNFSVTSNFKIKENHINYLLLETVNKFNGIIELLNNEIQGHEIIKFINKSDVKVLMCSLVDPSLIQEKEKIIKKSKEFFKDDKVYYLESNFQNKNDINTLCWHFFIEDAKDNFNSIYNDKPNQLGYKSEVISEDDLDVFRNKKFLCFNRLVNRKHRASLLYDYLHNDFNDSYFSFLIYNNSNEGIFQNDNKEHHLELFNKSLPIEIDTQTINKKIEFITGDALKKELFLNSCIHIVTETSFEYNELFFSEKIFKPILGFQPFIVFGPKGYLKELKTFGFKTFSVFWDESYDDIEDSKERYNVILSLILELNKKSIEELNDLYQKTKNICIYNKEMFHKIKYTFKEVINTLQQ